MYPVTQVKHKWSVLTFSLSFTTSVSNQGLTAKKTLPPYPHYYSLSKHSHYSEIKSLTLQITVLVLYSYNESLFCFMMTNKTNPILSALLKSLGLHITPCFCLSTLLLQFPLYAHMYPSF